MLRFAGSTWLRFHSGHRNNVFQAKTLPESADKTIVTCAADGQVTLSPSSDDYGFVYLNITMQLCESLYSKRPVRAA